MIYLGDNNNKGFVATLRKNKYERLIKYEQGIEPLQNCKDRTKSNEESEESALLEQRVEKAIHMSSRSSSYASKILFIKVLAYNLYV